MYYLDPPEGPSIGNSSGLLMGSCFKIGSGLKFDLGMKFSRGLKLGRGRCG